MSSFSYPDLERAISSARAGRYLASTVDTATGQPDPDRAVALYEFNSELSAAAWSTVADVEVVLRNALAGAIAAQHSAHRSTSSSRWYDDPSWFPTGQWFTDKTLKAIKQAMRRAKDPGPSSSSRPGEGRVIAEFNLGFWRYLLIARYEHSLWNPAIRARFPALSPAELGDDPCAGKDDGDLAPWTTPDGAVPLRWAAAVPMYTFGHLLDVLAPNGRGSDGWAEAPADGDRTEPFGVPLESTVSGLILVARTFGVLAPPGAEPSSDIVASTDRLLAGNPFPSDEPAVRDGIEEYRRFKSPLSIEPHGRVPIFWVQGFTDALFPANQAVWGAQELRAADPDYPVKLFLGDLGHDYAAERTDEWDMAKDQMNAFVDHHLRPDRTPDVPEFDVTAAITRCLDPDAPADLRTAPTWHDLHPRARTFTSDTGGTTSTATVGPAGVAADPISTATLPGPDSYKGCRIMEPSEPDPTVVTYEFTLDDDLVTIGAPVVSIGFDTTGTDTPLAVRVWDVAPDRSRQGLVTRGVYRVTDAGADQVASFQLAPQGYRFPAGHHLKVEVTANDSPYLQASNVQSEVNVTSLEITLPEAADPSATTSPTTDTEAEGEASTGTDEALGEESSDPVWPLYLGGVAAVGGAAVAATWLIRRRRP